MPKDNDKSDQTYESEFAVIPPGKILSWSIGIFSFAGIHYAMSSTTMSWPLQMALSLTSLSLSMAVRMSALRAEMVYLGNDAIIKSTKRFAGWSCAQMNNLEYTPFIMGLGFFREYQRATLGVPLSFFGELSCKVALGGCYGFIVLIALVDGNPYAEKSNFIDRILSKYTGMATAGRGITAASRYFGIVMLVLDVIWSHQLASATPLKVVF